MDIELSKKQLRLDGVLSVKLCYKVNGNLIKRRDNRDEKVPRRTQQEDGHLPVKERRLRRNQICWHLDLGWTNNGRNFEKTNSCGLSHPVCDIMLWQP